MTERTNRMHALGEEFQAITAENHRLMDLLASRAYRLEPWEAALFSEATARNNERLTTASAHFYAIAFAGPDRGTGPRN